jgi:hypothetical protein
MAAKACGGGVSFLLGDRKQRKGGAAWDLVSLSNVHPPMTYFFQLALTFQSFHSFPKGCHQLGTKHSKYDLRVALHIQTVTDCVHQFAKAPET